MCRIQRKCWWDGIEVDVAGEGEPSKIIKLWARRVWTLELSLVRTLFFQESYLSDACSVGSGMIVTDMDSACACSTWFALDTLMAQDVRLYLPHLLRCGVLNRSVRATSARPARQR